MKPPPPPKKKSKPLIILLQIKIPLDNSNLLYAHCKIAYSLAPAKKVIHCFLSEEAHVTLKSYVTVKLRYGKLRYRNIFKEQFRKFHHAKKSFSKTTSFHCCLKTKCCLNCPALPSQIDCNEKQVKRCIYSTTCMYVDYVHHIYSKVEGTSEFTSLYL